MQNNILNYIDPKARECSFFLSGSTHGGHYHCYIRDVDGLGTWSKPEEEEIQIPVDPATGKVDFIEFDSPIELIQAILTKAPERVLSVDKLCAVSLFCDK